MYRYESLKPDASIDIYGVAKIQKQRTQIFLSVYW